MLAKLCKAIATARDDTTRKGIEMPKETSENRMQLADNKTPKNPTENTEKIFTTIDFFIVIVICGGFHAFRFVMLFRPFGLVRGNAHSLTAGRVSPPFVLV